MQRILKIKTENEIITSYLFLNNFYLTQCIDKSHFGIYSNFKNCEENRRQTNCTLWNNIKARRKLSNSIKHKNNKSAAKYLSSRKCNELTLLYKALSEVIVLLNSNGKLFSYWWNRHKSLLGELSFGGNGKERTKN